MIGNPYLSVVIPVYNEADSLRELERELREVLAGLRLSWEVLFIDDGSNDGSPKIMEELRRAHDNVRVLRFQSNRGQTAAFAAGFRAARGEVIVTMDADLQNDPGDIPALLEHIPTCDLVCGWRRRRSDTVLRRVSSRVANSVRNRLSGEHIRDVGCSLKVFRSSIVKQLKLYDGMHRFFPTLVRINGGQVLEVPVNHRPRRFGAAKYNIRNRLMRSFIDLLVVCWMKRRTIMVDTQEEIR